MRTTAPRPVVAPGRILGRTALAVLAAFGILAAALALLYWSLHLSKWDAAGYSFDVTVVTPLDARPELAPVAADVQYSTVTVVPQEHPDDARLMAALALSSRYLIGALAALTVAGLAITLLRGRGLGRLTAAWLGVLGGLMAAVAVVEPWLRATAVVRAVEALGLPTDGEAAGAPIDAATWVVPHPWDWTDTDWFLLLLGLVVVVAAVLVRRARGFERDVEGLV